MHITQFQSGGSKITKIAIVTALHLAVGMALVNNMKIKISAPDEPPPVVMVDPVIEKVIPPPPPPVEPVQRKFEPIVVPETIIDIHQPTIPPVVTTTNKLPPKEPTVKEGPVTETPVAPPAAVAQPNPIRIAVAQNCPAPEYPARSARNGDAGTVTLALLIGVDGRVAKAKVQKTSGHSELDRAAIAALSSCDFKPATNGGKPEQAWAQIAYVWTLEG